MINEKISKNYLKVLASLVFKKFRQKYQLFIVEGEKIVFEIIRDKPSLVKELVIREDYVIDPNILRNFNALIADESQMKKISSMSTAPPLFAICKMDVFEKTIPGTDSEFDLLLDDIRDPGNAGTIIRTAEWFGFRNIYFSKESIDIFHPKLIQSSMGSFFRTKCVVLDAQDYNSLKKPLIGAVLDGISLKKMKAPLSGTLVIGNESNGISEALKKSLDLKIKIDDADGNEAESLNAAIATGILLHALSVNLK